MDETEKFPEVDIESFNWCKTHNVLYVNNMAYWITTSNWYTERVDNRPCSGAMQRNERHIWWYDRDRDNNLQVGDMVLVYQGGVNDEARKANIKKIDKNIKCCFIGNFTIGRLVERNDPLPCGCPEERDNDDWVETVEQNFLWPQKIKRITIGDGLLVRAAGQPDLDPKYVGLIFKNKTWIRLIEGEEYGGEEYYNLVMNRHIHNLNLP